MAKSLNIAKLTALTAAVVSIAFGATAPASAGYNTVAASEVQSQLREVLQSRYQVGYQLVGGDVGYMANNGAPGRIAVHLEGGATYRIAGRCDGDCHDVDLAVVDGDGDELIADRDLDDTPSFDFRPTRSGTYYLHIELADCHARQCHVGAVVLKHTANFLDM